jgi:hypothetical protein
MTIFGAAEPRLRPLDPAQLRRVHDLRSAVDDAALGRDLAALPAPRVRAHAPQVSAALDARLRGDFERAGWTARLDPFRITGEPGWGPDGDLVAGLTFDGVNVVASKEGTAPEAILVVAHHDTVPGTGGADDNGTGIAGLLALARLLGPARFGRSVLLAAVDHEEIGFLGARRLVGRVSAARPIAGAYVFEMLGYTSAEPGSQRLIPGLGLLYPGQVRRIRANGQRGDFCAVLYRRSGSAMAALFAAGLTQLTGPGGAVLLRAPTDLPVLGPLLARAVPFTRHFARSDHLPFWEAGLPAVQITDTANFRNPHYHEPGDVPETIDLARVGDVVAATAFAIETLAGRLDR